MLKHQSLIQGLFFSVLLLGLPAAATATDSESDTGQDSSAASADPRLAAGRGLLYRPPSRGAPLSRVGSGSRGHGDQLPVINVLAPDHAAFSSTPQPKLYWFISEPHPADIEITISRDDVIEPVLEVNLGPAKKGGVHSLSLADYDISLEPGKTYRWYVALIVDPKARSQDHGMGSALIIDPTAEVPQGATPLEQGIALAESGLWHDAIETLSQGIRQQPGDSALHEARAALLEQVGLQTAAAYDRRM